MPETEIYTFEPASHPPHTYTLDTGGVRYRPPRGGLIAMRWEDILFLEDVSGRKVDIVARGSAARIPVFYGTRNFSGLLAAVCARLAERHRDQLEGTQTFRGNRAYIAHKGAVLCVFAVLILGSTVYLHRFPLASLFTVAATLPMGLYILRQPHTVTPLEEGLALRDYLRTRFIAYGHIEGMGFDLVGDQDTACLCIMIRLAGNRIIKIQRFDNLVLLFLYMQTKWERHRKTPLPHCLSEGVI